MSGWSIKQLVGNARTGPVQPAHSASSVIPMPLRQRPAAAQGWGKEFWPGALSFIRAPGGLPLLLVTGLMARSSLLGTLAPFHFAILVASAARQVPPAALIAQLGIIGIARWLAAGPLSAMAEVIALAGLVIYLRFYPWGAGGAPDVSARAGVLAGAAAASAGILVYLFTGGGTFALVNAAFQTVVAALTAVIFAHAMAVLAPYFTPPDRSVAGGSNGVIDFMDELVGDGAGGVRSWEQPPALSRDEWLSVVVLLAAAAAGLQGLALGPVRLDLMTCAVVAMVAGRLGGAGAGAAAGAAVAGMAVLNGMFHPVTVGIQSTSGLLTGLLAEYGLIGGVGGYMIGYLLLSSFYDHPAVVLSSLWSLAPAVALMLFANRFQAGRYFLAQIFDRQRLGRQDGAGGAGVYEVSHNGGGRPGPGPFRSNGRGLRASQHRLYQAKEAASMGLTLVHRYSMFTRELAQAFDQGGIGEERFKQRTVTELVNKIALKVCPGCIHREVCWDKEFLTTFQALSGLLTDEQAQTVTDDHIPGEIRRRCPRRRRLATAVENARELMAVNLHWRRRMESTRRTVTAQLRAVSDVLERSLWSVAEQAATTDGAIPTLPYRVGVARVPKDQKLVSGDSYLHRQIGDDRLALVLSDGMGAGMRAAAESRVTVNLLEKLLELGFDETTAIRSVNQMLLLRPSDEVFSTLDLALIGLRDGSARFIKIGAAPTFIRRGKDVEVIRAGTLPMGILNEPEIKVTRRMLQRGDVVVMVTDGVIQAWDQITAGEEWVRGFLSNLDRTEPRHIAAGLLQGAMRRSPRGVRDDMTVMVLKML